MAKSVYAGYPTAFVHETANSRSKKIAHLLWGTWIEHQEEEDGDWAKVRVRGWSANRQPRIGWMKKNSFQENRVLEIYFVDIGQGDGCLMITPDDKFHLIDAGEGRNMAAFLRWKFNLKKAQRPIVFENTIITHSDSDHYKGFLEILKDPMVKFKNVYHNGLIERTGDDLLGAKDGDFMTDVVIDDKALDKIIGDPDKVGKKFYPNLMKQFRDNGAAIRMLCSEDKFLPGYGAGQPLNIEVLGPVPEIRAGGKRALKWFGDNGKTKNGHSVVLKLNYGGVKILLGGDLNIPAENHLLQNYTQMNPQTNSEAQREKLIKKARKTFEVDVAKACHHGSADFTSLFLQSLNSAATVISSGDNEPHVHPRPDAIGAFGKFGRGDRPLIFSTELARSAKEMIIKAGGPTKEQIGRTVAVYGMINLRTDGDKIVLAQKMEEKAARGEWDFYELKRDENGVFVYASKHDED